MAVHDIDLAAGDPGEPIADIAQRLLADGADPSDHIRVFRNNRLSQTGVVGRLVEAEAGADQAISDEWKREFGKYVDDGR